MNDFPKGKIQTEEKEEFFREKLKSSLRIEFSKESKEVFRELELLVVLSFKAKYKYKCYVIRHYQNMCLV